jgi:hypothetical protein
MYSKLSYTENGLTKSFAPGIPSIKVYTYEYPDEVEFYDFTSRCYILVGFAFDGEKFFASVSAHSNDRVESMYRSRITDNLDNDILRLDYSLDKLFDFIIETYSRSAIYNAVVRNHWDNDNSDSD